MHETSGALALVGSGEYTPAMNETDRVLLETIGGASAGKVALFPTASALEPGMPERWNAQGADHFSQLGATVTPLLLLQQAHAADPTLIGRIAGHNFLYFSGGSPDHCIETLAGSGAWAEIQRCHASGAVLAGCSAGAMMLGGYTTSVREMRQSGRAVWRKALGLVPELAIMPHFDRLRAFVSDEMFREMLATAPAGVTLVGVDEDTALLRLPGRGWIASGRQMVHVFAANGTATVYQSGEQVW